MGDDGLSFEDVCSRAYEKEWRMVWARAFIRTWLMTPKTQFPLSLDLLTIAANRWIYLTAEYDQLHPVVSREDVKEAISQILGDEDQA
jgi:hypothetical protein